MDSTVANERQTSDPFAIAALAFAAISFCWYLYSELVSAARLVMGREEELILALSNLSHRVICKACYPLAGALFDAFHLDQRSSCTSRDCKLRRLPEVALVESRKGSKTKS